MLAPRSTRTNLIGALISAGLVLLFSFILLCRDPLVFWNDDYQISILPVFSDVARSWSEGHLPLLSPYSWVCANLAGEYQYGTFSIFVNLAVIVIWKIFAGFAHQAAALSILHLVVLALGGYALARSRKLSLPLAVMVSLIAALNGWIICWGASDWFGALGAFAWMPWAWWGLEGALNRTGRWRFLWPAPFVYLVATGGFPYTVLMLGLLIAWLTIRSLVQTRNMLSVLPMLFGAALGFGLAAPAILALLDYVHGSAREGQPVSAHWQWIVPPAALPGLLLPNWTVRWTDFFTRHVMHTGTELACGLVAPSALLCAFVFYPRALFRRLRWELVLLGVVLIIAMLPTAGVFRWSFRWLPFFHLILAVCGAECLQLLGKGNGGGIVSFGRTPPAIVAVVLVGVTALAMKIVHTGGTYFLPLTWILLALAVFWAVAEHLLELRLPIETSRNLTTTFRSWTSPTVTFTALLATYLCIPPICGVPRYNFNESLTVPAPLNPERLYLSIYPPPELAYRAEVSPQPIGQIIRPGSTPMWARLRFINGYSPIRPRGVATQFYFSIHGEVDLGTASLLLSRQAGPEGELAQLGVDGITIAREINFNPEPANEWDMVASTDEGRVFHRRGAPFGRVRSVTSLPSRPGTQFVAAKISAIVESRARVQADIEVPDGTRPALITFSRPYFEGYRARTESIQRIVSSERGLFPVVEVPGGCRCRLVLTYEPTWLLNGRRIAIACAAIWVVGLIAAGFRRIRHQN